MHTRTLQVTTDEFDELEAQRKDEMNMSGFLIAKEPPAPRPPSPPPKPRPPPEPEPEPSEEVPEPPLPPELKLIFDE